MYGDIVVVRLNLTIVSSHKWDASQLWSIDEYLWIYHGIFSILSIKMILKIPMLKIER